ncbi:MAG: DHHA1 domain-containing protein [Alphaproteobacteria bacterium]|jgi:oligoribonuclease NrnB/cAMP/cGMP phosphodiesterase (DHH superfamily)|nr:DHHA1 domain-containing protein [Alphaproteobacteria bacterium]
MKVYVIYHRTDFDGRGSAAVINDFYRNKEGFEIVNIPLNNEEVPHDYKEWDKDAMVYMSDISFPKREQMEYLLETYGDNFIWNDHHASSMKNCEGLNIRGIQRADYAAIQLTWFWFNQDKFSSIETAKFPEAINYVGHVDIKKPLKDSEEFLTALILHTELYDPTNPDWEKLINNDEGMLSTLLTEGRVAQRYRESIEQEAAQEIIHFVEFEGYKVPAANIYFFKYEVFFHAKEGNLYEEYPFVITYYRNNEGQWKLSLRGTGNEKYKDIDVSLLAKKHGGGGHKKAAGIRSKELPFKYL